jgi:diadenosine tetraphosphate (Ap4A) HIT family hydrolase
MALQPCVFCDITADRVPASFVYRDEHIVAFLDIRPATPGHLLVVPTRHVATLGDLDEDLGAQMWRVATRLAAALRSSGLPCEGINIFLADGEAAFQDVFHTHLHVLPRSAGDGFRMDASGWDQPAPSRDQLDRHAESIRAALAAGAASPSSKDH